MCFNPTLTKCYIKDPFYFHQMINSIYIYKTNYEEVSPDAMVLKLFCRSHPFGFQTHLKSFTVDNFLNLTYSTIIK